MHHIDGTPWGTRGGIAVVYTFPADGDYTLPHHAARHADRPAVRQRREPQRADRSVDQRRARGAARRSTTASRETDKNGLNLVTPRIHVKAGPQHVAAAFIQKFDGVVDDLVSPIEHTLADTEYGDNVGITILPHLRDFSITGPYTVTGVSDTPSRRKVFICRPTGAGRRDSVRAQDHRSAGERGVPASGEQRGRRVADGVLRARRAAATTSRPASARRCRRCWRARTSCSASRRCRRGVQAGAELPHQPTSISRRGCPTSSGARRPTRSW